MAIRTAACVAILLTALRSSALGAELWVDQAAAPGGDGSATRPLRTIGEAVKAAKGGDTITVRQGTYPESVVLDKSGTDKQPTVLRAPPGQRVILSGFLPITGWQPYRDQIQTATVEGAVEDLFVGCAAQPVARWPDVNEPWRYVKDGDPSAGTIRDAQGLAQEKWAAAVAAQPAGARLYLYVTTGNFFTDAPLTRLDPSLGLLATSQLKTAALLKGKSDRFQITNHPALVRKPGQWAAEPLEGNRTRVYFWPAKASDLQGTQTRRAGRPLVRVGHWKQTVSHVRVEGLEITGGARTGIELGRAEHVTICRCIVHHNAGNGIAARRSQDFTFEQNIVVANGSGISMASSSRATVQQNEIASNMVDGLIVAGNVSGKPDAEPTTCDVLVRQNYIHHHLLLGHPDNVQTYRGVERLTLQDNVLLWGGQGVMTEETNHSELRNCVVFGTGAIAVIFGHGNAGDWTVQGCTIGLGGWGALSLTARNYQLHHNIFFHNAHGLGETITGDYNLYAPADAKQPIALVSKPKWRSFLAPQDAAAATGQLEHSLRADPGFRSAPARQAISIWHDENTLGRLLVRQAKAGTATDGFAVGDRIEVNGDGVLRRVTAVEEKSLAFEPPLAQLPLRSALIWNWKQAAGTTLDLRPGEGSPALAGGKDGRPIGATLDIPAFQRGDFDGDGKRDLPDVPEDLKPCWPDPNDIVLPLHGS